MDKTKKNSADKEVILVKKTGNVVSDKNDKTIIVEINDFKTHPVYGKKYRQSKRYKVHDAENEFKVGDRVTIVQCRPISKEKTWRVFKAVKK
jgi:small subunit ribosomal protein S17